MEQKNKGSEFLNVFFSRKKCDMMAAIGNQWTGELGMDVVS